MSKPFRLKLAQRICRPLPPLFSQRLRSIVYPRQNAIGDDYEFDIRALTGSRFVHRTGDFHAYPFSVHGFFDWRNWAVAVAICSPGDIIVEIGANIGTETIGFADIVGRAGCVHAFEPLPDNIASLRKNIVLNQHEHVNVYPVAVGAITGKVRFALPPTINASGVGYVLQSNASATEVFIEVDCIALDSLIDELGEVRAMFVDVEGAEIDVLRGARNIITNLKPVIVLEASPRLLARANQSLSALYTEIEALDYRPFRITRLGLADVNLRARSAGNWLCIPTTEIAQVESIKRMIRKCGLMPCLPGLSPLILKSE